MNRSAPLLALLLGCPKPAPPEPPKTTRVVQIAALNDFHGALYELPKRGEPTRAYGGLPWLASALDALRTEHPDLLVLDGGDIFQGSWPVNATKGRGAVLAYNLLGVDVAAVGNHEFDYGGIEGGHPLRGALEAGGKLAEYDWVAANIREEGGQHWGPEGFGRWVIVERGGVKVGVLGLSTQDTPQTTLAKNVADLTFEDVVATAREVAPKLREAGAEVVVAVGHLSGQCEPTAYDAIGPECMPGGEVGRLLTELEPGTLDVMIMGHAHTLMHHRIGDTFVLEQRAQGHAIGRLELVVGPEGVDADASTLHPAWFLEHDAVDPGCTDAPFPTEPIDVGGRSLAPHAGALALIEQLEAEAGSLCDEVGCTTTALTRDRKTQNPVGDFVSTSMLAAFPDADVAVTNAGGLRADVPEGTLRREHLQAVMPFDNRLLVVEMTGSQLETLFRLGTSGGHGLIQIDGASLRFDPEATAGTDLDGNGEVEDWERDRLCHTGIQAAGAPLDPARTYRVVTTDFLFNGGDHLGHAFEGLKPVEEGPLLRDAMNTWFASLDTCYTPGGPERISQGACAR
ncbi:MAG: bifunctional UDP-sugar hydrolase/5'-nucleotidase [Myxococcota bacterium]